MRQIFLTAIIIASTISVYSQDSLSSTDKIMALPDKFFGSIERKAEKVQNKLLRSTEKYLSKLNKQELKMQRKMAKTDTTAAKEIFGDVNKKYSELRNKIRHPSTSINGEYNAYNDSIQTALRFLNSNNVTSSSLQNGNIDAAFSKYAAATSATNRASMIQRELKEREDILTAKLQNSPVEKSYQNFKRKVYYYKEQVNSYRRILNDPGEITKRALGLLNKLPAFNQFMSKNSLLDQLFPQPDNITSYAALSGLQSRVQIQQVLNSRSLMGGGSAQNFLQQSLQSAQNQLSQLRERASNLSNGSGDVNMPDFIPNTQKTKSLIDRLELGYNMQTTKSNRYFPSSSTITVTIGYKLNDHFVIGTGASYILGVGTDIHHIRFSSQGMGFKSYFDYKLKANFWATGGTEYNYRSRIREIADLKDISAWSRSILMGISKKAKISKKVNSDIRLLYDALWNKQIPQGQPFVFRFGYSLK